MKSETEEHNEAGSQEKEGGWSELVNIEDAKKKKGPFNNRLGIYQICVVTSSGQPIPICRLAGVDKLGVLYIGRSGYNANRSIANRIREFSQQKHSGGITYTKAKQVLEIIPQLAGHCLQVRAKFLSSQEIKEAELCALNEYFSNYAELPPCNSARPKSNADEGN